uniref:Uncharacterized protein n=1 Tax=Leersia perrieri TaxID=77586 RepID=A0A0D9XIR3_9ORYZ
MICRSRGLLVADLRPPIQRRRGLFLANLPTTCHLADRPPPRRPLPRRSAATENPPCRAAAIDSSLDPAEPDAADRRSTTTVSHRSRTADCRSVDLPTSTSPAVLYASWTLIS